MVRVLARNVRWRFEGDLPVGSWGGGLIEGRAADGMPTDASFAA